MKKKSIILTLALVPLLASAQGTSQEKQPVGLDFFAKIKAISQVKTIGDDIFFILRQASVRDDKYNSDLYQLVDGKAVRLTETGRFGSYEIIDDAIVTRKPEGKKTVFYKQTKSYGGPQQWLTIPYQVGQVKFVDDNHFFFTSSKKVEKEPFVLPDSLKAQDADKRYRIFEDLPFWSNGRGDIVRQHTVLYYSDNGKVTALTDSLAGVGGLELSTNGRYLVYTDNREHGPKAFGNKLYVIDTKTLQSRELTVGDSTRHGFPKFIDDENLLLSISKRNVENPQANAPYYRLNVRTGEKQFVYDNDRYAIGDGTASDIKSGNRSDILFEKQGFVFKTTKADYSALARLSYKDGQIQLLTPGDFNVDEYVPLQERVSACRSLWTGRSGAVLLRRQECPQAHQRYQHLPLRSTPHCPSSGDPLRQQRRTRAARLCPASYRL